MKENKKEKKIKKNKKLLEKFIPKTEIEMILTVTFIVLLIIVIILSIKAFNLKKEFDAKNDMDLVIPVLEAETNNAFSVDLSEMKKDEIKEYKFMITNYKDKVIAEEELEYNIELTNNSDSVSIKLYREEEDKNLLTEEGNTYSIENNKLIKDKKDTDTYYLIIRAKEATEKEDNISIKIAGIN